MNKWWKFQKDISNHFWVIQNQPNFIVDLCQPKGHFRQPKVQNAHLVGKGQQQNLVDFELLKSGLRYQHQIFTSFCTHEISTFCQIWKWQVKKKACHALDHSKLLKGVAGAFFDQYPPNLAKLFAFCRSTIDITITFGYMWSYKIWKKMKKLSSPYVQSFLH